MRRTAIVDATATPRMDRMGREFRAGTRPPQSNGSRAQLLRSARWTPDLQTNHPGPEVSVEPGLALSTQLLPGHGVAQVGSPDV
jgi:hypothetical protein